MLCRQLYSTLFGLTLGNADIYIVLYAVIHTVSYKVHKRIVKVIYYALVNLGRFTFKNKTVRLVLKPGYADRIRRDVKRGIELYGNLTEPYWQYVRALALQYWLDFDRHEIFDMYVGENTP